MPCASVPSGRRLCMQCVPCVLICWQNMQELNSCRDCMAVGMSRLP